ncbi:hypothetical protein CCAX7_33090 [Capsulimonas corticalis]|uniref:Uncharacterized protein n=1 Tax=Capsulimonas corticalis TaxID=2219043 RepID=A0A402CYN6_9BACT|nr:hypothetical protein [Capsulimonas corticalis]BDI31258.1 hypothetical protein CCAX7_33090 [Capsulimonas corticalis]
MKTSIPLAADIALTVWVVTVAVVYFGGYFAPNSIGIWTGHAIVVYALMLLASVGVLATKFLAASDDKKRSADSDVSD